MGFCRVRPVLVRLAPVVAMVGLLAGCALPFTGAPAGVPSPNDTVGSATDRAVGVPDRVTVDLAGAEALGAGVNSYLWRAALDTIAFMPLASADPYGGVIITDWRATPDNPNERFKLTVYVLDPVLRADAVKVSVFRQTLRISGIWADAPVDPKSATKIENSILARARQFRLRASVK